MNYGAIIRETETGRGRKVLIMLLALLLVALVIGVVVRGFRGYSPSSGADALTGGAVVSLLARSALRRLQTPPLR
jgi:hypothetical protein